MDREEHVRSWTTGAIDVYNGIMIYGAPTSWQRVMKLKKNKSDIIIVLNVNQ